MIMRPPRSTRTDTRLPSTTLVRSLRNDRTEDEMRVADPGQENCDRQRGGPGSRPCEIYRNQDRSEEHTSELQSRMRITYAVLCLNKVNNTVDRTNSNARSHL